MQIMARAVVIVAGRVAMLWQVLMQQKILMIGITSEKMARVVAIKAWERYKRQLRRNVSKRVCIIRPKVRAI